MSSCLDAALAYAAKGWRVFALPVNSKIPAKGSRGFKDATIDPETIHRLFAKPCNIGIATGNGLYVLDVDKHHDGEATIQNWEGDHGLLPNTYTVQTPRGGRHYYFTTTTKAPTGAGLGLGVDVRGDGGYVVAPPSPGYTLIDDLPLAPLPDWLATLKPAKSEKIAPNGVIPPGQQDDQMHRLACKLTREGLSPETIRAGLHTALLACPQDPAKPFTEADIERWMKGAAKLVAQDPPDVSPWAAYGVPMTQKSQPICNADAALAILERHPLFEGKIWFDVFRNRLMTTWEKSSPHEWQDTDTQRLLIFLQREIRLIRVSKDAVCDALGVLGTQHRRHEVADWIKTLTWDGTRRLEGFLTRALGAEETPYIRAASQNFWISLAARIFRPGCQVDHMLVLEGPQGQGKTSALRALGGDWYLAMHESVMQKDFFQLLPGRLIVEIDELDSFQHAEVTRIKQIISTPSDSYRASYGRLAQTMTRQCVFVGTTNDLHYLRDMTGNRRFWPVRCGVIDLPAIKAQRDQLFAEAARAFHDGASWWIMPEGTVAEQEARREEDAWEPPLRDFLFDRVDVTIAEVLTDGVHIPLGQVGRREQRRAAAILRAFGWGRQTLRAGEGFVKRWVKIESSVPREPGDDVYP